MNLARVVQQLDTEASVSFVAVGNSMTPRIQSGERVTVRRLEPDEPVSKGDVVLARVNGRYYLHLVSALNGGRVQISNNKGRVNGWTPRRNVLALYVKDGSGVGDATDKAIDQ